MALKKRIDWTKVGIYTGLIIVGFVSALLLFVFTGQVQFGKDAPAWVQAVGSVAGIAVAIAIPLTTSRRDERKREQTDASKARTFALHLIPQADKLHSRLRSVNLLMMTRDDNSISGALKMLRKATELDAWGYQLHELGRPRDLLQRSIAAAAEALTLLDYLDFYNRYSWHIVDDETGDLAGLEAPNSATPHLLRAESLPQKS